MSGKGKIKVVKTDSSSNNFDLIKQKFFSNVGTNEVCECPLCDQILKRYKRRVYDTMALGLILLERLARKNGDRFYHIKEMMQSVPSSFGAGFSGRFGGGDFAKMAHFGLIREKPKDPNDTKSRTSGYWQITDEGSRFVRGRITVPGYVVLCNNQVCGFSEEWITIRQALGDEFNYDEVMRW